MTGDVYFLTDFLLINTRIIITTRHNDKQCNIKRQKDTNESHPTKITFIQYTKFSKLIFTVKYREKLNNRHLFMGKLFFDLWWVFEKVEGKIRKL
jgi:hypothetical protein